MESNRIGEIKDHYGKQMKNLHSFRDLLVEYPDLPVEEISEKHDQISDFLLFTTLLNMDIIICCKHLLIGKELNDIYEMNYFTRALAIHCSDVLERRQIGGGSRFLNKLEEIIAVYIKDDDVELKKYALMLDENRIKLEAINEQQSATLKFIRNNLFAHRDKTGIEQNEAINKVSAKDIGLTGEDIYNILFNSMGVALCIHEIIAPLSHNR